MTHQLISYYLKLRRDQIFFVFVSRNARGKGRAVPEEVGLDSSVIEPSCFQSNTLKDEEAIQAGLIKWTDGGH